MFPYTEYNKVIFMHKDIHFQCLIGLYRAAPINGFYQPEMQLEERIARIEIETKEKMHHTLGFIHGSVYFKMLDDAAYFAAQTTEREHFLLTSDFRIDLIRPFQLGRIVATGTVQHVGKKDILAHSELRCSKGKLLATGVGKFTRSTWLLAKQEAYTQP